MSQARLTKLIRAVLAAGIPLDQIAAVELTRDGARLRLGDRKAVEINDLDAELAAFKAANGQG